MKKLILLLVVLNVFALNAQNYNTFNDCPMEGDAKGAEDKNTNTLKNRYTFPTDADIDKSITLEKMLAPGNDENRFSETKAATITGYVVHVSKKGSSETCNCHAKEPLFTDTHIDIVLDPDHSGKRERVVVEVTPRMRAIMADKGIDWSSQALQDLIGKRVTFTGWLLWDWRHKKDAENTDPGDANQNWRATCWEIHPVTSIEVEEDPMTEAYSEETNTPIYFTSSLNTPDNNTPSTNNATGNSLISGFPNPPSTEPGQLLKIILLASILGMCGQVIRVMAGLKKIKETASEDRKNIKSVLNDNTSQILFSLIIALIVGGVSGILVAITSPVFVLDKATIIALITAGYAGTDFIEGFIIKR